MKLIIGETMAEPSKDAIKVQVLRRLDDGTFKFRAYDVPFVEGMSVLNVLNHIFENIDSTLSYFVSCRIGLCGRCDVVVNGKVVQACNTIADDGMTVDSMRVLGFKPIKDLIAEDVFMGDADKLFLSSKNAFHRFNNAYARSGGQH